MRAASLILLVLVLPLAAAQASPSVEDLRATAGNARVDLEWSATSGATEYVARAYHDGSLVQTTNTSLTRTSFSLSNGRSYAFTVAAKFANGTEGAPSLPAAATPRLPGDLAYLAAGLIVTWAGLFAYAFFLNRRERVLERRLEQLLQHDLGRNPP